MFLEQKCCCIGDSAGDGNVWMGFHEGMALGPSWRCINENGLDAGLHQRFDLVRLIIDHMCHAVCPAIFGFAQKEILGAIGMADMDDWLHGKAAFLEPSPCQIGNMGWPPRNIAGEEAELVYLANGFQCARENGCFQEHIFSVPEGMIGFELGTKGRVFMGEGIPVDIGLDNLVDGQAMVGRNCSPGRGHDVDNDIVEVESDLHAFLSPIGILKLYPDAGKYEKASGV